MTAEFAAHLAVLVLSILCFGLLAAVGIQLDFGQPEHVGPRFTPGYTEPPSQREQWAAEFASVRAEIRAMRQARHDRQETSGWWANTDEFEEARMRFFGQPSETAGAR